MTEPSMRLTKPFAITTGLGFPSGLHVAADYAVREDFAVGASVGTIGLANEYVLTGRHYVGGTKSFAPYVEGRVGVLQGNLAPVLGLEKDPLVPEVGALVGVELRSKFGFTARGALGATAIHRDTTWCDNRLQGMVSFLLSAGWAF